MRTTDLCPLVAVIPAVQYHQDVQLAGPQVREMLLCQSEVTALLRLIRAARRAIVSGRREIFCDVEEAIELLFDLECEMKELLAGA